MSIKQTALVVGAVAVVGIIAITLTVVIARVNFLEPELTLSISSEAVFIGEPVVISWVVSAAESCIADGTGWSGERNASGGQEAITYETEGDFIYELDCFGVGGEVSDSLEISVRKSLLNVDYPKTAAEAERVLVGWDASGLTFHAECAASGGWAEEGLPVKGTVIFGPLTEGETTFVIRCEDADYSEEKFVSIYVPNSRRIYSGMGSLGLLPRKDDAYEDFFPTSESSARYMVRPGKVTKEAYVQSSRDADVFQIQFDLTWQGEPNDGYANVVTFDEYTRYFECGIEVSDFTLVYKDQVNISTIPSEKSRRGHTYADAIDSRDGCE